MLHMHCIDIVIGEDWCGIASGIISFRNNSYGPWFMSKMHFCSISKEWIDTFQWNFAYALIYIYIYMIYSYPITFCFSLFFYRVTALDLCTKCVSPKYLPNKWSHFEKILLVLLSKWRGILVAKAFIYQLLVFSENLSLPECSLSWSYLTAKNTVWEHTIVSRNLYCGNCFVAHHKKHAYWEV